MPLYYLNLKCGNNELPNDSESQEFADLEAARIEAGDSLRQIAGAAVIEGRTVDYDGIDITDLNGTILLRVPMAKSIRA